MPDAPIHAVLYRSLAARAFTGPDLDRILDVSVPWNSEHDLTGRLLYGEMPRLPSVPGQFVQWLEGPEAQVAETFERVRQDRRHTDVHVLARGPASELTGADARLFPAWAMSVHRLSELPATLYGFLAHARLTPDRAPAAGAEGRAAATGAVSRSA